MKRWVTHALVPRDVYVSLRGKNSPCLAVEWQSSKEVRDSKFPGQRCQWNWPGIVLQRRLLLVSRAWNVKVPLGSWRASVGQEAWGSGGERERSLNARLPSAPCFSLPEVFIYLETGDRWHQRLFSFHLLLVLFFYIG
jgi:hypothetical protein